MTAQDFFHTSPSKRQKPARSADTGQSAPLALVVGGLVAAGLIWLAQDTVPASDMPDWHGNVAASVAADIVAR